ncbi:MAG: transketolase [Erysipelotrichaceae bacterium]
MNNSIKTLKFLGVDAIEKANSGHPGIVLGAAPMMYALYSEVLKHNPSDPEWFDRDRFIMAAGHGSALLYSALHLSGYPVSLEDLKQFRQLNSLTPGHPEYRHTKGIDATSGPLGQGIAMAVGMAISESFLSAKLNSEKEIINHYTYALCGDGDLQEGVTQEAMSLAGHLALGKLIVLYDSNDIQLDGPVSLCNTERIKEKYEAMNWQHLFVSDGSDYHKIIEAINTAKKSSKPTIIEVKTIIGADSTKAGQSASHGSPLAQEAVDKLRKDLDYHYQPFEVASEVYQDFKTKNQIQLAKYQKWQELVKTLSLEDQQLLNKLQSNELVGDITDLNTFDLEESVATRVTGGKVLNQLSSKLFNLMGGSADLTCSTKVMGVDGDYGPNNLLGRNINFGVREHAMGAIINGMSLHGGIKAFSGAFFVFSDYMKPAIRMAALMNIPSIFVFTHDSLAVGEDGPTHQPIEQLTGLRAIPNLNVIRPAGANETLAAWQLALTSQGPTVIVLTRQNVENISSYDLEIFKRGAYIASKEKNKLDGILIAAGSEVSLAVAAQKALAQENIDVRVISMPSSFLFDQQSIEYQESILPKAITNRLAIEMGSSLSWYKYSNKVMGIDSFGTSAPYADALKQYHFEVNDVVINFKK